MFVTYIDDMPREIDIEDCIVSKLLFKLITSPLSVDEILVLDGWNDDRICS